MSHRWSALRYLAALTLFAVGVRLVPCWWCSRDASAWWRGDSDLQDRLSRGVDRFIEADLGRGDFSTGHRKYDGEWLFATYMMAGMGHGQLALARPETRTHALQQMRRCVRRLTSHELRAFDREAWGHDPLATLGLGRGADHGAYLGYLNLLLSLERRLHGGSGPGSQLNDRVTATLLRRLRTSPILLLQSYPREAYPIDNCAVVGSIGLHARATGKEVPPLLKRWERRIRERYLAPDTGLLIQRVHPTSGSSLDAPRGSGTALCAYFTSFALPRLSKDLYAALRRHLMGGLLGFGMVREYPPLHPGGAGDIDSGPVILGYGVSATGFALGPARIHGDPSGFTRLLGTAVLFGAPVATDRRLEFATGGPVGNAILFAMLTATRGEDQE
jgi:hypothetical protein